MISGEVTLKNQQIGLKDYDFTGRHLIASYSECDNEAMLDVGELATAMRNAVRASGATLLKTIEYTFPNGGFTMIMLLSESHASIHTYPEHNACFVDIFTCGSSCIVEKFDIVLRDYLHSQKSVRQIFVRNENC